MGRMGVCHPARGDIRCALVLIVYTLYDFTRLSRTAHASGQDWSASMECDLLHSLGNPLDVFWDLEVVHESKRQQ